MRNLKLLWALSVLPLALSGCGRKEAQAAPIQTVAVERRDIVISAEATGVVEPINVVEVKSKASGQIVRMPVETGTQVRPGDLLVQVDTRDVRNQYEQALADVRSAEANLAVAEAQKKRSDDLFAQRIITAQEHETAALSYTQAQAQIVRARTNLDLAQQRLEDATVRAPVAGTVIEKTVSLGQVITSATGAFGGGTTLLKMADLNQVRVRAMVNETDIGNVQSGQEATVTVDAYPDRPFRGVVEKIEPQAVVQQSVTMFPVLISVSNQERLLMPGMNGEVSVLVEQRNNVLAVPNDAVRNPRDIAAAATSLGLNPERVREQLQAQMAGGGMSGGGAAPQAAKGAASTRVDTARGSIAPEQQGQGFQQQLPEVTPAQCARVDSAFARKPDARTRLQGLRDRARSGELDLQAVRTQSQAIYAELGVDAMVARACTMRSGQGAARSADATPGASGTRAAPGAQSGPVVRSGAPETGGRRTRTRAGLVFVADSGGYAPRMVRLGASNYDYTEVVSGLKEGERVALLAAAALQQQRQQQLERIRGMTGTGVPGMQRQQTGGAGGAAAARPR
ncbi:MAG TPA: efflux RND transporter periplasmic adaptor subunit [Gemmatimonadaceae bacterium]|nr:efflux RND transporter periplasmic adaptor subunit [Gemmatimonadaceae bacterium]